MHTAHGYAGHSNSTPLVLHTFSGRDLRSNDVRVAGLIGLRRSLSGSLVGIAETQELVDFCAKHKRPCRH